MDKEKALEQMKKHELKHRIARSASKRGNEALGVMIEPSEKTILNTPDCGVRS